MVDSTCTADMLKALPVLRELSSGPWRLADLAWARVTRWREAIAQMARAEGWDRIEEAEITWAGPGAPPAAAYLAAWVKAERLVFRCETPVMPPAGEGRIKSVCVTVDGRQICLRREGTGVAVEVQGLKNGMVFPLLTDSLLLHEELAIFGADARFEAALKRIPEVLGN
jgi:glucose-6-phosphate dehydrogenase assembly protein OpcA